MTARGEVSCILARIAHSVPPAHQRPGSYLPAPHCQDHSRSRQHRRLALSTRQRQAARRGHHSLCHQYILARVWQFSIKCMTTHFLKNGLLLSLRLLLCCDSGRGERCNLIMSDCAPWTRHTYINAHYAIDLELIETVLLRDEDEDGKTFEEGAGGLDGTGAGLGPHSP